MSSIDHLLDEGETIELQAHRHLAGLVVPLMGVGVLAVLSLFGVYLSARYGGDRGQSGLMLASALMVFAVALAFAMIRIHRANQLILTTKSLYLLKQTGILGRNVTQFGLDQVENISVSQSGIVANTFNYGDLTIETAGEKSNIAFIKAPDPHHLADIIMDRHEKAGSDQD